MQSSPYNNPMLAQGLSGLVESFIGNPSAEAQAQEAASRALLNNQTAQYRDAIGETGMAGDLASMMVRSLQAGPDYSRHAPNIGDAAIRMGTLGFGSPQLTPSGDAASMLMSAMQPRTGGRSSGSTSAPATPASDPVRPLTQSEQTRAARFVRDAGYEGAEGMKVLGAIMDAYNSGDYPSLDHAAAEIIPKVKRGPVQTGVDQNDSPLNPMDWFRGPTPIMEEQLIIPGVGQPAPEAAPKPKTRLRYNPETGEFE